MFLISSKRFRNATKNLFRCFFHRQNQVETLGSNTFRKVTKQ